MLNNPKILVRWTIGPVRHQGFLALRYSIEKFAKIYNLEKSNFIICCNNLNENQFNFIKSLNVPIYKQKEGDYKVLPKGVAWKLYPPRLNPDGHELFIDNDLIIEEKINEIEEFFDSNKTLVLEDNNRAYGKFENYISKNVLINSGLFGLPPDFDLKKYMDFYIKEWQKNTTKGHEESFTWDEQGLIALILPKYPHIIIRKEQITKCEKELVTAPGMHFIKLNRKIGHEPFANYLQKTLKIYL